MNFFLYLFKLSKNEEVDEPLTPQGLVSGDVVCPVEAVRLLRCGPLGPPGFMDTWCALLNGKPHPRFRSLSAEHVCKNIQIVLNILWSPIADVRA